MREVIASQLLARRKPSTLNPNSEAQKALSAASYPARLNYTFLYHTRLWKRPRLNVKGTYASILSLGHEHKFTIGKFRVPPKEAAADRRSQPHILPTFTDPYLHVDREAKTSIKDFASNISQCHQSHPISSANTTLSIGSFGGSTSADSSQIRSFPPRRPSG